MIEKILSDRAATYGRFYDLAHVATTIRNVIFDGAALRNKRFAPDQEEALSMICSKLARIVNGDEDHVDSWRDIAGYAQLVVDRLEGKTR